VWFSQLSSRYRFGPGWDCRSVPQGDPVAQEAESVTGDADVSMFVRFVVGTDGENHRWLTGIITEARLLRDRGRLAPYHRPALRMRMRG